MIVSPILRGGVGNCLFGMATAYSYCLKHNADYSFPIYVESPHNDWNPVMNFRNLDYMWVKKHELKGNIQTYKEPFFHYQEIPKYDCDYLFLDGYFQSHLYFNDHRTQILRLLNIPYEYKEGYVSLHIRRGDYLLLPNCHPVVTLEYIHSAIEYFMIKGYKKFIVFSDDIAFCYRNIKRQIDCIYMFSEGKTELEDLAFASSCEHSIGSNSAYSFFIYWLNRNKNKIGIFPRTWFGKDLSHDTKDLYPESCIKI